MHDFLDAASASPIGEFMATNVWAFPLVETLHVMAITMLLGLIVIVDLRLLGVASRSYAITRLSAALLPSSWIAFIAALITGALLFTTQPATYFDNTAFRVKMLLILLAGFNMIIFHRLTMRDIALVDRDAPVPAKTRLAGLLSIIFWVLVVAFGRWIGFTTSPF